MNEQNDEIDEAEPEADEAPKKGARAPKRKRSPESMQLVAAAGIEISMLLILVSGLITALAFDITNPDNEWKIRVKLMSLSEQGFIKFTGVGFGIVVPIALFVALAFAANALKGKTTAASTYLGAGAVAISLWLGMLTALSVYIDFSDITGADFAAATAIADVATLVLLVVSGWWGYATAGSTSD